jgi:large subunit ribosomal protein L35
VANKSKPRNACSKRFKVTGTGKIMRRRGCQGHLLTKKSAKRKRTLGEYEAISGADRQNISRMLTSG